jgi:hypothetical protein
MQLKWIRLASITALTALASATGPAGAQIFKEDEDRPGKGRVRVMNWTRAAGTPVVPKGRSTGFYIWHDRGIVHLVTTSQADKGRRFSGKIHVRGGRITDLHGEMMDRKDRLQRTGPGAIAFNWTTGEKYDELMFRVQGGERLVFELELEGKETDKIYVGKEMIEAKDNPVVFNLR